MDEVIGAARRSVLDTFRWQDGHAEVWRLFEDASTFAAVVAGLAAPYRGRVDRVCGIESRGFVLGAAVAAHLGVGFVAIRKQDGLFPGPKISVVTEPDYRQRQHVLRLRRDSLRAGDVAVLVDDWAERGSQALAARRLVEQAGATWAGVSLIVHQLPDLTAQALGELHWLVKAHELGDPLEGPRA